VRDRRGSFTSPVEHGIAAGSVRVAICCQTVLLASPAARHWTVGHVENSDHLPF